MSTPAHETIGAFIDAVVRDPPVTEPCAVHRLLAALGLAAEPPPGRPVSAA